MLPCPPCTGRASELFLELAVEEGHIVVADMAGDLGDRRGAKVKQACGLAHALAGEEPLEAAAALLLEKAREIGGAY